MKQEITSVKASVEQMQKNNQDGFNSIKQLILGQQNNGTKRKRSFGSVAAASVGSDDGGADGATSTLRDAAMDAVDSDDDSGCDGDKAVVVTRLQHDNFARVLQLPADGTVLKSCRPSVSGMDIKK
eukprot:6943877-Karenia_brevis.AAC.1